MKPVIKIYPKEISDELDDLVCYTSPGVRIFTISIDLAERVDLNQTTQKGCLNGLIRLEALLQSFVLCLELIEILVRKI